jgi:hypothetical protein
VKRFRCDVEADALVVCVQHHNPTGLVIDWFRQAVVEAVLTNKERGVRIIAKLRQTLYGQDEGEKFGRSIALSMDRMTLAVGADGTEAKGVQVYQFHQFSALWVQLGRDLWTEGQGKATVGTAVTLPSDGITCACADFSIME